MFHRETEEHAEVIQLNDVITKQCWEELGPDGFLYVLKAICNVIYHSLDVLPFLLE